MRSWLTSYWNRNRIKKLYVWGAVAVLLSALLGLLWGGSSVGASAFLELFSGQVSSPEGRILLYLRLPRVLAALLCGGALALSGALIQGVLCNPLASPGVVGVNAGAGLAVTLAAALGCHGGWQISALSFLGAFLAAALVSAVARRFGASRSSVILMGVAQNSLLGAVSDGIVAFFPEVGVFSRDFKLGEFSAVTYERLWPAALLILVGTAVALSFGNELAMLGLGAENACGMGLDASRMRPLFLLLAALLAGCAVSLAGLLSFVGLLVPHAVRRMAGGNSARLLGLCVLFGGAFVCTCDTVARSAFAPYELPVGILMAFLGAPFFLFILLKKRGGANDA